MRTDVLMRHPIYERICNWSQWLWSHGEWLGLISMALDERIEMQEDLDWYGTATLV